MRPELWVGVDAYGEPTLWRWVGDECHAVLRLCDLAPEHRDLWPLLTGGAS